MTRRGDWIKFHCGDRVVLLRDPRHAGVVRAVLHGAYVRVKWDHTTWTSDELFRDIEREKIGAPRPTNDDGE